MMESNEVAAALTKIKPLTPFILNGVISVELNVYAAALARWVQLEKEVVFWVGIIDEALNPHLLLCHDLADDGDKLTLKGIHGDEPYEAWLIYSARGRAPQLDVAEQLKGLKGAAAEARIIGPLQDEEVAQVESSPESDLYL